MKGFVSKKVWLTTDKKKFCIVRVYPAKKDMQEAYETFRPGDRGHDKVLGAHCGYEKLDMSPGKRMKLSPETGTVFLSMESLGAGIVAHELMHAVIWAKTHKKGWTDQYPFTIKGIAEEEKLLHNLTYAIRQFYDFYWKKLDKKS